MKKLFAAILSAVVLTGLVSVGVSAKDAPKVVSAHIIDSAEKSVEINFSEPVNIKNLGWIVAVNQYPNGSNPYATFDWGKMTFHLYGCVDKDGKPLGDNGYLLNTTGDSANEGVYTTRIVTYLGEIGQQAESGSSYSDLHGIEFQNLGQGLFTAADGRTIKGDADGRLYVAFSDKNKPMPPETADGTAAVAVICLTAALVPFCLRKKRV